MAAPRAAPVVRELGSTVRTEATLCMARKRPRLPLRREVDACIKDLSRQTEGEIHKICAKAVGIDEN